MLSGSGREMRLNRVCQLSTYIPSRGRIRKNIRFEIRKFLRFSNFSAFENRFEFESNIFLPLHVVFRNTFRIIRIEYLLRTTFVPAKSLVS
jgi:uncharacterized protein VirK/YbjX